MRRVHRVLTTLAIGATAAMGPGSVFAQTRVPETQTVRLLRGTITGSVSDERGGALAGATVSAVGRTWATAVTDVRGQFSIDALPPGEYVLQAHLSGFAGSRREMVHVPAGAKVPEQRLMLRRLEGPIATTGAAPVYARPIIAAGIELPTVTLSDKSESAKAAENGEHPHTEIAWRLRHYKRSILKDSSTFVTLVEQDRDLAAGSIFGRAVDSAASIAATFFTDFPFSGEVNLLTTSAYAPGENPFSEGLFPRGVAYLAIGAPTSAGDWSLRAAMSQGDLSSWIVSGAFASKANRTHQYDFGYTYSTQEYIGGNPSALAGVKDGSRNVGEVFAYDRYEITPRILLDYGGRYSHYDYLENGSLFSPTIGLTIEPVRATRVSALVAQRMVAPGAEEFLASESPGPWLPPERTFAPLGDLGDAAFQVERARYVDLAVEREFGGTYVVGVRRFFQDVDNQLVTLFGIDTTGGPEAVGHYYVASAGAVDADGWAFRLATSPSRRIRGSVDYSVTRARWLSRGDDLAPWAPAAIRPEHEDIHDVTTSIQTEIPETATRLYVLYKINTAFTRSNTDLTHPGLDARFDVQVNQALPFGLGGTKWEVLVGVRNLFRDPTQPGSMYDELLVVRPPKRVVGGFLVRF